MKVTVAFLHADSPALDAHWMNRAARIQATSQDKLEPYIHCELLFPDGNSYSITANHQHIHRVQSKNFARDEWEFLDVHLPDEHIYKMQMFCNQKYAAKAGFNWVGFTSASVWPVSGKGQKYFCSEFVTEAMQYGANLLVDKQAASVTPARLYSAIRQLPQCIHNVHPKVMEDKTSFRFTF